MCWAKRIGLLAVVGLLAVGGYVGLNWAELRASHYAGRVRSAGTAEERSAAVVGLLVGGDAGFAKLTHLLRTADEPTAEAVRAQLKAAPPTDRAEMLLAPFAEYSPAGQAAVLALVPDLKSEAAGQAAVQSGLSSSDAGVRAAAVRLTPKLGRTADAVPLTRDTDPAVRTAALVVAGSQVEEEELFRLLHDPADGVREAAEGVLLAGGRSDADIALGRRLAAPSAGERLRLVSDLLAGRARDPGPWLERLARDPEPAVRAAAARAAADAGLPFAPWLDGLATDDPDPAVRQVARFHRGRMGGRLTPVGGP